VKKTKNLIDWKKNPAKNCQETEGKIVRGSLVVKKFLKRIGQFRKLKKNFLKIKVSTAKKSSKRHHFKIWKIEFSLQNPVTRLPVCVFNGQVRQDFDEKFKDCKLPERLSYLIELKKIPFEWKEINHKKLIRLVNRLCSRISHLFLN